MNGLSDKVEIIRGKVEEVKLPDGIEQVCPHAHFGSGNKESLETPKNDQSDVRRRLFSRVTSLAVKSLKV